MASRQEASAESSTKRKAAQRQGGGIKVTKTIRKPREPMKHIPSAYLAEMKMNTEERLATVTEMYPPMITGLLDIATSSHHKDFSVSVDQALFQPFPSEVVFQQFLPHATHEFPLNFRNNDRVARHLQVTHEDSPYFRAVCQRPAGSKVAPGMEVTYIIHFTPDEKKDYQLELVCTTERERFVVPVRAVGVRALLDFPDQIHFPSSPVKYPSTKTILVRNVGDREAQFTLQTESPYSVSPTSASLKQGHCMQVTVTFLPLTIGDSTGELSVHYDTGEAVYSSLHGSSVDVNVRLDRNSVRLENTYIGLSTQRSVTLHNRSKVVVHYQWKAFSSTEEEEAQKELQLNQLAEEEALTKDLFLERCMHNPALRDRLPIIKHSLAHKKKRYVDVEKFLFADENIIIDPVEGEIWPNSQAEISIIFSPSESVSYSRVAYCDVTGRESRLPLRVAGQGFGPRLMFSFDTLDIQNVFINSAHAYEVILENKGDIDAEYKLTPTSSLFGPFFTFSPSSGILQPGALQAIQISFRSTILGEFSEAFQWMVAGSPSSLSLRIIGAVIGPTFQFDTKHINYGSISYGFLSSQEVVLTNTSEIPLTYRLRVPSDERGEGGEGGEFEVTPNSGVLPPNYHQNIQVDFVPAAVKVYSTEVVLFVAEAGMEMFSLPISAKSEVPPVTLDTPYLDYGRCFLHYPYTLGVSLNNPSSLPVKYEMQLPLDERILRYSTDPSDGVISPRTTLELPLQIEPQVIGEVITAVVFRILGSLDDPLEVTIRFVGEGPVINASSTELHWGCQPVLTPLPKMVHLSNESLIPAEFECVLSRERTVFSVDPPSGVIAPQDTLRFMVTANIDDCLRFTDKVTVVVSKGVNITISLSAEGEGTTIVSQPSLQPRVNLGPHFCNAWPCRKQFTLTNRGRRLQALSWTTQGFSAAKLKKMEIKRATRDVKDVGRKRFQPEPKLKKPVFRIIPDKLILEPYETRTITLEGTSNEPVSVMERLICHAIIGKNPHKERIMTVDMLANFIAPLTEFSTRKITFTTYQPPGSELVKQTQTLAIHNVSALPFTAVLLCIYPFSFKNTASKLQQLELELSSSQKEEVTIQFDPTYCKDRRSRREENQLVVAYKQHPLREYLNLRAEVYFPNLEFESSEVDFGCILNDTETIRYVKMTNTSPLEVHYKWYFLRRPPVRRQDPEQCDEGVDMVSECETDSLTEDGLEEESQESGEQESEVEGESQETSVEDDQVGRVNEPAVIVKVTREEDSLEQDEGSGITEEDSQGPGQTSDNESQVIGERSQPSLPEASEPDQRSDVSEVVETAPEKPTTHADIEKQPWELVDDPFTLVRIEQVFDILPLHGTLLPGESQQMQFTFYGYADIATECMAACKVDGGPTYQVRFSGEASNVQYRLSHRRIDFGQQLYSQVVKSELVLYNTGKVDMDFTALAVSKEADLEPGGISVQPPTGHIPSLESMTLTVHFLPGVPDSFQRVFQIQVAHLQPEEITLVGEGVFPRIVFNLPSQLTEDSYMEYSQLRERARQTLVTREVTVSAEDSTNQFSDLLQLEMEKMLVKEFVLSSSAELETQRKKGKLRPSLPPYLLDFGYVVYGSVETCRVTLTNTGSCPVSFNSSTKHLEGTGFSVDIASKVRALPGAPDEEEGLEFSVQFDPAAVQCPLGLVKASLPFNLFNGPTYSIQLTATVTKPSLQLSRSEIDFESVVCGQCKIVTLRICNPFHVSCCWLAVTDKPPRKIPKHVPMHVRRKMKDKPPPTYFEVDPPSGVLQPGQKYDIRIRFMPTEELDYEDTIPFRISQNPDSDIVLMVKGHGSEPQVEFDRQLVQFPAVLPFADGSEAEVTVSNPMPYSIEIYSLEYDKQYLEEEEVLRWVKGYDTQKRLFLPPIVPGEKLPTEILQAWEKEKPNPLLAGAASEDELIHTTEGSGAEIELGSQLKLPSSAVDVLQRVVVGEGRTSELSTTALLSVPELGVIESVTGLSNNVVEGFSQSNLDGINVPPVAAAIARHMGIELSPEGAKGELRKGVAFIVDGPPMSGRTTLARSLAKKYNAVLINLDDILKDLISEAKSLEGRKLRQFCIDAENERRAQEEVASVTTATHAGKKTSTRDVKEKEAKESAAKQEEFTLPLEPFTVLPLLDTDLAVPESELLPVSLPREAISQILEGRVQQNDCRHGVVFDGIESVFTPDPSSALKLILEAIHNRKHIYMTKIEMELAEIQERKLRLEKEAEQKAKEERLMKEKQKREEEERVKREMEIDEDEYEGLSEEGRIQFDQKLLAAKKEKSLLKQKEMEEKERIEREKEEEEKRISEEMMKKKKGKGRKVPTASALGSPSRPMSGIKPSADALKMASQASFASGMATPGKAKALKSPGVAEDSFLADPLERKYNYHTHHSAKCETLLADWDRIARVDRPIPPEEPAESLTPVKKSTRKASHAAVRPPSPVSTPAPATPLPEVNRDELGVPLLKLDGNKLVDELIEDIVSHENEVPTPEEILEILGLGANGPPVAEPTTLQVYPYPLKRMKLVDQDHFTFIAASSDDPNAERVILEPPPPEPQPVEPPVSQGKKRSESRQSPLKQSRKKGSSKTASPQPGAIPEDHEKEKEVKKPSRPAKLASYRWIVPACGKRTIKLLFNSKDCGQFDQTLNFEIAGTRQRYQLFCRGQCHLPAISREPRIMFQNCKKYMKEKEIVHKKYIISDNLYVFGPLHTSKNRERYKEGKQPENMEKLTISNPEKIVAEVSFYFCDDADGATYLLDPPTMTLDPGDSQTLTIWAFPRKCQTYSDALVCCMRHNPDPVVVPIACTGVEPELKFEPKQLDFKKVLLHRKQTNVLTIANPTLLPVAWKLGGLEQLGDEFSFNQDQGIVQPLTSFPLQVSFRAAKPVTVSKKAIQVKVSDVENHMGLMHTENISIVAEAYDVAMDISFPRGADGGLDFQCIFAGSDHKLTMQLKNKGKYDIGFAFSFTKARNGKIYSDLLKVSPAHAVLYATEKSTNVNVTFHSNKEVSVKDESILKCEVIDRHVGDHGEVIACIPIKVSAKAVFSKFRLSPATSVNFGAMVVNTNTHPSTKNQCAFTLENCGDFEFRYAIIQEPTLGSQKKQPNKGGRGSSRAKEGQESQQASSLFKVEGGRGGGRSKPEVASIRTEVVSGTLRLVLGMFTIHPATGSIPPGQTTTINVECAADKPGKQAVALRIEIGDRRKDDPPIIYHIYGDVLEPSINSTDLGSIFEEHGVCSGLGVMGPQLFHREGCVGVYGETERRFAFKSVIVGQAAKARFKIINSTKIPCDAKLAIVPTSSKQKSASDVFEIEPRSKCTIPSHSHIFATVTFRPTSIQTYAAGLEVYPDGYKQREALSFELQGDGNLPQVEVVSPSLKNAKGQPLLLFRRLLTDQAQTLRVSLCNIGTIPAVVQIRTKAGKQHYTVTIPDDKPIDSEAEQDVAAMNKGDEAQRKGSACSSQLLMCLNVGETQSFSVTFRPQIADKCRGELSLKIRDNVFEAISVQLVGEGYQDDVSVENIHGGADREHFMVAEGVDFKKLQPEEVEAPRDNGLDFGDFPVGEARQITFALTNHGTQPVKFQWPSNLPGLVFSPTTGHLHPSTSKDVCVSFRSDKPVTLKQERVSGKIWKIQFKDPLNTVSDWDDRHKMVHWVNIPTSATADNKILPSPAKKKVVEIEPEPLHTALDDSRRELALSVWATADYARYKCDSQDVRFTDTLLYQTRAYKLPPLSNTGQITLSYKWSVVRKDGSPFMPRSLSQPQLDRKTEKLISDGGEAAPFTVSPSSGQILPGKEAVFSIRFSPLDVRDWECKLVCSIPHLDSSCAPLEVGVSGKALMPYCHFELEPSDYLTTRKSAGKADLAKTQVIEFHSCGVGAKIVKCFEVINPTIDGYEFNWTYDGASVSSLQPGSFKCLTPKGFVEAGRKFEMAFEFTPTTQEMVESVWRFSIPALSQSFLLVGHTTEPAVLLDRAYVNLHSSRLGFTSRETVYLVNNESTAYPFEFVKESCYSSGHMARVKVNPLQGTVNPHSRLPIEISYMASLPREFSFDLKCRVKRKPTPLHLNVKAVGYATRMSLSFRDTRGNEVEIPVQADNRQEIDFGEVPVNERALGQMVIFNRGDYNFQYRLTLSHECSAAGARDCQLVSLGRTEGTAEAHSRCSCELIFSPPNTTPLKDCTLTLDVVKGPTLVISVLGYGVKPKLVFSPAEVDFDKCYLSQADLNPKTASVVMTNKDNEDLSVKCLFENSAHFQVHCERCLLQPEESSAFQVAFRPTKATCYEDKIEFEVNGLSKTSITAKGEGVPMKVVLVNPEQKVVDFGVQRVCERPEDEAGEDEKQVEMKIPVVNCGPIPTTFSVSLSQISSQLQEDKERLTVEVMDERELKAREVGKRKEKRRRENKIKKERKPGDAAGKERELKEITLEPDKTGYIIVKLSLMKRISKFEEEVTMDSGGVSRPLFMVTGCCLGHEFQLDMAHIPFGAVWQGSQSTRRILIINSGDIGASFKWDFEKFAPHFSISPTEGYLSPGMEVPLDVTFHPRKVSREICYERLPCEIEDSSPLHLTLSGVCTEQTPVKEALHFTTAVRSKERRQLTIHNKSNNAWQLTPIIDGQQWTGPDSISIDASSHGHYELTYHPLTMTTESSKHHGSIFFPFPDGDGLLYNLLGTAEPPKMTAQIVQEVPCRTPHTELLTVENWIRRPQRFRVTRELLRPDKLDPSVSVDGMDYIDVPALGKSDYQLKFHSFKECTVLAKVTFKIEQTGEYMFYHVSFKSTPPGIEDVIELCTPVRQRVSHDITISNPLNNQIAFSTSTTVPEISLPPNFVVGPVSNIPRTFEYLPLRVGETVGKVTFSSSELGSYQYELRLVATPPTPEPPLHFTCHLGGSQQQHCKVHNHAKGTRVEYGCKIRDGSGENSDNNTDFHVEKSVTASGTEVVVDVTFEPSHLGDSQGTLFLTSTLGGDYTIPLVGHCLPPRPEGPFTVRAGQTVAIPFKNVFPRTMQFSYSVNCPAFSVKALETVKARKTCNMQVTYDAKQADPRHTKTGKLVVTSQHSSGSSSRGQTPPPISWVYYLKGVASL